MAMKRNQGDRKQFEAAFGTPCMRERFDRLAAVYVQERILPLEAPSESRDRSISAIETLLKESHGKDTVEVLYKKGELSKGLGRWFACSNAAMQRMPRRIRHTLCKGIWLDLDFENAHPAILSQLCSKWGIKHRFISRYVDHREEVLDDLISKGATDRDEAKECILKALNGGNVELEAVPWWRKACREFSRVAREIAVHEQNKLFHDCCMAAGKTSNFHAKVMNTVLCHHENSCLEQLYEFLVRKNCIKDGQCSLIFDGIMLYATEHNICCTQDAQFLREAARFIQKGTGLKLSIKLKEFSEAYDLPQGYRDTVSDMIVIDRGDDSKAAKAFLERYAGRLIKCNGRVFWYDEGVYTDNKTEVQDGIITSIQEMKIYTRGANGQLSPYSSSTKHMHDCMKLILASNSTVQNDFVEKLWHSNLGYLAFEDGVYSFENDCLIPYPVEGVFFTYKIKRKFPTGMGPQSIKELVDRVLKPILPCDDQRSYFLHCLARALAGKIYDKRWYICVGERNSGKGVLCELMSSAFQDFVQTINSENLLYCR